MILGAVTKEGKGREGNDIHLISANTNSAVNSSTQPINESISANTGQYGTYIHQTIYQDSSASKFECRLSIISVPNAKDVDKDDETNDDSGVDCHMMGLTRNWSVDQVRVIECHSHYCPSM